MGGVLDQANSVVYGATGVDITGGNAAKQGMQAQQNAARDANATQLYMYEQNRADTQPYREIGAMALDRFKGGGLDEMTRGFTMADFQKDPGYQFRMQEGQKALESSAAARGGLNSGATLKALSRYNQDFASNELNNAYNRYNTDRTTRFNMLSGLAGTGQTSVGQVGAAGQNYANAYGQNVTGAANAQAAYGQQQQAMTMGMLGTGAGILFSDARVKTNITPLSKAELSEMKKYLKAYAFNYKSDAFGKGDWVGVMAQDLEKSKLGRTLVIEDKNGIKRIDLKKVLSIFLATMAEEAA